mmetsp:Transcript_134111/g.258122  ORF Transcript_134111/g.258122 Transcript_134111/m.258122 type:complete len:95 (-) Transcript_134111:60-344(-)
MLQAQIEKLQRVLAAKEGVLGPGEYILLVDTTVTVDSSTETAELKEGTQVKVMETKADGQKLCGRIDKPAGWISMRDTSTGFLWVVPNGTETEL